MLSITLVMKSSLIGYISFILLNIFLTNVIAACEGRRHLPLPVRKENPQYLSFRGIIHKEVVT